MNFVVWTEEISVGVEQFDEDHRKLVSYINKLHIGLKQGEAVSTMLKVLDGLVDYTANHFKNEESLMIKHGYPDYDKHKAEHDSLVQKVLEYQNLLKTGKSAFSLELLSFLKDWLIFHIKGSDMLYKDFFSKVL